MLHVVPQTTPVKICNVCSQIPFNMFFSIFFFCYLLFFIFYFFPLNLKIFPEREKRILLHYIRGGRILSVCLVNKVKYIRLFIYIYSHTRGLRLFFFFKCNFVWKAEKDNQYNECSRELSRARRHLSKCNKDKSLQCQ